MLQLVLIVADLHAVDGRFFDQLLPAPPLQMLLQFVRVRCHDVPIDAVPLAVLPVMRRKYKALVFIRVPQLECQLIAPPYQMVLDIDQPLLRRHPLRNNEVFHKHFTGRHTHHDPGCRLRHILRTQPCAQYDRTVLEADSMLVVRQSGDEYLHRQRQRQHVAMVPLPVDDNILLVRIPLHRYPIQLHLHFARYPIRNPQMQIQPLPASMLDFQGERNLLGLREFRMLDQFDPLLSPI
ncbi:hypothetical protein D3C77_291840 [compost metagenome]